MKQTLLVKFSITTAAVIVAIATVVTVVTTMMVEDSIVTRASGQQASQTENVTKTIALIDTLTMEKVKASMNLLTDRGRGLGAPSLGPVTTVAGEAVPALLLGGKSQTNEFSLVDAVTRVMGGTATLFVARGDDFIRVSTNVKKADGSRAIGTKLDPAGKAIKAIKAGTPFYGLVDILGKPYLTGYEPMRDAKGATVGIWYVGYEVASLAQLGDLIRKTRILDNGFIAMLDGKGGIRFRSEHVSDALVTGLLKPESPDRAAWNVKEVSYKPWGFTIVTAHPHADVSGKVRHAIMLVIGVSAIIVIVLVGALNLLLRRSIVRPVEAINGAIRKITAGDFNAAVPKSADDEIGTISDGVSLLAERLGSTITRINTLSTSVADVASRLNHGLEQMVDTASVQHDSMEQVTEALKQTGDARRQIIENTERLLQISNDNLAALIEISTASEQMAGNAGMLSSDVTGSFATTTQLSQSAQTVAEMAKLVMRDVEQTSSSLQNLFESIVSIEESAKEAVDLSSQTTKIISEKGVTTVADAGTGMRTVGSFLEQLLETVELFSNRSVDIEKILGVIEEITEQTRLLALNAQIIASQSGESGKSFSIVSNEMRELSEKTASSTKEIENIVAAIKREISDVVSQTKMTAQKVDEGRRFIEHMEGVLGDIHDASQRTTAVATVIESATHTQSGGLKMIATTFDETRERMHEVNKATDEQGKAAADLLRSAATIKDATDHTLNASNDQAKATKFITTNIESSNKMTEAIATASQEQQSINKNIVESLEGIVSSSQDALRDVRQSAALVTALKSDMDTLVREISVFAVNGSENGDGA